MFRIDGQQRRKLLEKLDLLMMQSLLKVVHQPSVGPVALIER
jgi:hypothetical protein